MRLRARTPFVVFAAVFTAAAIAAPPLLDPETDKPGLKVGEKAPHVEVVAADGETINLGELYGDGPVVVSFYRGGWCPFCNRDLASWRGRVSELESAGAKMLFISPESKRHAVETSEKHGDDLTIAMDTTGEALRGFKVGFDPGARYTRRLGGWNNEGRVELPAPAVFVIDTEGVVRWAYADWDIRKRADPDDVIEAVKNLD